MPKAMHEALKKSAKKHGFKPGSKRYDRYVYGGMKAHEQAKALDKA